MASVRSPLVKAVSSKSVRRSLFKPGAAKAAPETTSAPASPFNARGVVEVPSFALTRPIAKGEFEFTVRAHEAAPKGWIA